MSNRPFSHTRRQLALPFGVGLVLGSRSSAWAASPKPPGINLTLEVRLSPAPPRSSGPPGSVTFSTQHAPVGGGVWHGTHSNPDHGPKVQTLRTANGDTVRSQWQRVRVEQSNEVIWTPQGPGVAGGERRVVETTLIELQPTWPGLSQPALVRWRIEVPGPASGVLGGSLYVPPGEWMTLYSPASAEQPLIELRLVTP